MTIPPYILPASPAGVWECVVNWPVVFQCGEVGFVTVQRRCRLTYLFPAGATPRRPAEQLPARSPPPPAQRDPIDAATDGAAGTEWILRRCRSGVLVRTPCCMPHLHAFEPRRYCQRAKKGVPRIILSRSAAFGPAGEAVKRQQLSATDESKTQAPQVNSLQQVITRHSSFLSSAPHTRSPHTRSAAEARGGRDGTVVGEGGRMCGRRRRMASRQTLPPSRRTVFAWLPATQRWRAPPTQMPPT